MNNIDNDEEKEQKEKEENESQLAFISAFYMPIPKLLFYR